MCAVIFASEILSPEERLGIDVFVSCPIGDNEVFGEEFYGGNYFPGGPKYIFRGIEIPCYITLSPKGSITSEILADILKFIDSPDLFLRNVGGPTPFILFNGHGSRLELPFLSYINNPSHKVGCFITKNFLAIYAAIYDIAYRFRCDTGLVFSFSPYDFHDK